MTENTPTIDSGLERGITLRSAVVLNMIDMIGVGPFITLPLLVAAMHGPQSMLGWVLGAMIALSDGLVWAELGAMMPRAGGSYAYLREMYGERAGKFFSFLYVWQLGFSAPLSIASGCVGLAMYAGYLFPSLRVVWWQWQGPHILLQLGPATFAAMGVCALAVALLYRRIDGVGRIGQALWLGVALAMLLAITAGLTHFSFHRAFDFPPHAFAPNATFFNGLGLAMLIATYDYWGYYNVCFLGGEVRAPERNIPRAVVISILLTAVLYLLLNVSVLGAMPWREIQSVTNADARGSLLATLVTSVWGRGAGIAMALLVMWTAFASVYALLLGYSRVPYAAAADGNYFRVFAKLHPTLKFPYVSLLTLGAVTMLFCTLQLKDLIAALVVLRILLQFLLQQVGVIVLRFRQPHRSRPFKVWLYPLPPLLAMAGFLYILIMRPETGPSIIFAGVVSITGLVAYCGSAAMQRRKNGRGTSIAA